MKNDINQVAQAIVNEISKLDANAPLNPGTFHNTLGLTQRESEARKMAGWFLKNVEKMENDGDPNNEFNKYQNQLIALALEITGK